MSRPIMGELMKKSLYSSNLSIGRRSRSMGFRGQDCQGIVNTLFGKPDIAVEQYKLVILLDSCF
jgi:G:T-mismatch repair DNA endonuclease (very short patch repair protein)